jgi:hypothetical protein
MPTPSEQGGTVDEKLLSRYVNNLQDRYPAYQRSHRDDIKFDAIAHMFSEYLFMGSRSHFEASLQGILTDAERQRLVADPTFSRAWQIFGDLCWMKRKLWRFGILLGIIIALFGLGIFALWAAPYAVGPKAK